MSVFVGKAKTSFGATAVQIVTKTGRIVTEVEHTGSTHTDTDLVPLIAIAKQRIRDRAHDAVQGEFRDFYLGPSRSPASTRVLTRVYSRPLSVTLAGVYARLVFSTVVNAPVLRDLARRTTRG